MAACFLTPTYTSSGKRQLISDHIKGPLVAGFRSPLMKALDRSVETLGLWIVTSSVTFIKSANQCSFKLCLISILLPNTNIWKPLQYFRLNIVLFLCLTLCKRDCFDGNNEISFYDWLPRHDHNLAGIVAQNTRRLSISRNAFPVNFYRIRVNKYNEG